MKFLMILIFFFSLDMFAYEGDDKAVIMNDCITYKKKPNSEDLEVNFYDPAKTKITFYGDSRMDLVNGGGGYGNNTMAGILNTPYNGVAIPVEQLFKDVEIHNLGASGWNIQ
jgi:hypothetical protein